MTVWNMSIAGTLLILVILIVRKAMLWKFPKRTFLFLWELVMIRLLVPFFIPAQVSIYSVLRRPIEMLEADEGGTEKEDVPGNDATGNGVLGSGTHGSGVHAPGNSAFGSGTLGSGALGSEASGNGTLGNGVLGSGASSNGTLGNGTTGNGALGSSVSGNGTFGNGTFGNGTLGSGASGNGALGSGTTGSGTLGSGTTGNGSLANGTLGSIAAGNETLGSDVSGSDALGNGTTGNGVLGSGASSNGTTGNGTTGSTGSGTLGNGTLGSVAAGSEASGDDATAESATGTLLSTLRNIFMQERFAQVCRIVWLVGMLLMAFGFATAYSIIYGRYRYAIMLRDGAVVRWLKAQNLKRKVRVGLCDRISSPLTYGVFSPVILLPERNCTEYTDVLNYVLMHELTHIRHVDMLRKYLAALVLCVHWFNPMVWVWYRFYIRDIELACDETVVKAMKGDHRAAYAQMLLAMEEKKSSLVLPYSNSNPNLIRERIVAIMKIRKLNMKTVVAAMAVIFGVSGIFMTSALANEQDLVGVVGTEQKEENSEETEQVKTEYWTAEDYGKYLAELKETLPLRKDELEELEGKCDFLWTQDLIDQVIAQAEVVKREIENGAQIAKNADGKDHVLYAEEILEKIAPDMSWVEDYSSLEEDDSILIICKSYGISFDRKNAKIIYQGKALDELEIGYNQDKEFKRLKSLGIHPANAPESDKPKCCGGTGYFDGFSGAKSLVLREWVEIRYLDKYKESVGETDRKMMSWGTLAGFQITFEEIETVSR